MTVPKKDLSPHKALASIRKTAAAYEGISTIRGFVAPSEDNSILEIWSDLSGSNRAFVPSSAVVHSKQEEDGSVALYVLQSTEIRAASISAADTTANALNGSLLGGFGDDDMLMAGKTFWKVCPVLSFLTKYVCPFVTTLGCAVRR